MEIKSKSFALVLILLMVLSGFLLNYSVPVSLAQSVNASPTFTISIVASINNYSSTCEFGINPDSSTAYSSKYDSRASYPSSGGGVYVYLKYIDQTTFDTQKLSKYIVPPSGNTTKWILEVISIDQEGILTFAWNSPTVKSLTLEDRISKQVYADMNAVSNFSFTTYSGSVSTFYIVYQSATATTSTPSTSANPTPTPTIPELPWLVVIPLISGMFVISVILWHRKTISQNIPNV
jgi:hypothetical protein